MTIIQSKSLPKIFAKCGFNRNTHRSILLGPKSVGGAGFVPSIVRQGTEMTKNFLKHWQDATTITGKSLRAVLNWTQHQSGFSQAILANPSLPMTHVTSDLTTTVQNCLAAINGNITLEPDCTPDPSENTIKV